jgi:hypothetical protein
MSWRLKIKYKKKIRVKLQVIEANVVAWGLLSGGLAHSLSDNRQRVSP